MTTLLAMPTAPPVPTADTRPAHADAVVRRIGAAAVGAGLALVTYWWVADGGIRDLGGWVTGLDSLGRLTGLVASVLLLVQVLLMARIPASSAPYGQDRLARLAPLVGLHVVQPDARPHRPDHLGVRRGRARRRRPARCGT